MYADQLVVIERHRKFLLIETKHIYEDLPLGQRITLENFSRLPGCVSALVYGERSEPQSVEFCREGRWFKRRETNRDDFRRLMALWFQKANFAELVTPRV
jgi:hypothetical protein